jgi:hypothetical protein
LGITTGDKMTFAMLLTLGDHVDYRPEFPKPPRTDQFESSMLSLESVANAFLEFATDFAADAGRVSGAQFSMNQPKFSRPFKGLFCEWILEFESCMPSQPQTNFMNDQTRL